MTGRMTSVDPTIPDAYDPQSLNRASYVRNAPLNAIDPTGFADVTPGPTTTGHGCSPDGCYVGIILAGSTDGATGTALVAGAPWGYSAMVETLNMIRISLILKGSFT